MATLKQVKNKKGISYQVTIRRKPYKTIYKTFHDDDPKKAKKEALAWAAKIEYDMDHGQYTQVKTTISSHTSADKIETCEQLIKYFQKFIAPVRYASPEKYDCMYEWWIEHVGHILIKELSAPVLTECKNILATEKIIKGKKETVRKANSVNKYLMCFSAVLTFAVDELEKIAVNPMAKVKLLPKPNGRTRFLSIDEIQLFIDAAFNYSDIVFVYSLILFSTGGRYSEVLHLQVENIDFDNELIYYMNTKNKTHRSEYLHPDIAKEIKRYLEQNNIQTGYIFINKKTNKLVYMRGHLQKIIKSLGLEDFHIHDARHTTGSYVGMTGGSLNDIAEILGQKSLSVAKIYTHVTQKHTSAVLKRAIDYMFQKK